MNDIGIIILLSTCIHNVLLYLYCETDARLLPRKAGKDFTVIAIDYSEDRFDNFINPEL